MAKKRKPRCPFCDSITRVKIYHKDKNPDNYLVCTNSKCEAVLIVVEPPKYVVDEFIKKAKGGS